MARKAPAANAAYQQLKSDLKAGTLGSCYILYGEEAYLREYYLDRMRKKLLDGPAEAFNYHRFRREDLDWDAVAEAVEAMPMLAERTVVEVDDVDLYREPEAAREKLIAILDDLPDYCCLIFVYDTVPYNPDRRLKKLHQALEKAARPVEFRRQSGPELRAWIQRQARQDGKIIDGDAADHLAFLTDSSLSALSSELRKLTAYASGASITRQDVDAVVEPTLTAVSFDISNALADGDYDRAMGKLRDLLAMQQDALLLLGAISAQMRRLLYARMLGENGKGADRLASLCGLSEYAARLTMTNARRVTTEFCSKAVVWCLEADRQLKSAGGDGARVLELLLMRMAQEARR